MSGLAEPPPFDRETLNAAHLAFLAAMHSLQANAQTSRATLALAAMLVSAVATAAEVSPVIVLDKISDSIRFIRGE